MFMNLTLCRLRVLKKLAQFFFWRFVGVALTVDVWIGWHVELRWILFTAKLLFSISTLIGWNCIFPTSSSTPTWWSCSSTSTPHDGWLSSTTSSSTIQLPTSSTTPSTTRGPASPTRSTSHFWRSAYCYPLFVQLGNHHALQVYPSAFSSTEVLQLGQVRRGERRATSFQATLPVLWKLYFVTTVITP